MSGPTTPGERPEDDDRTAGTPGAGDDDRIVGTPGAEGRRSGGASLAGADGTAPGVPDGDGLPGDEPPRRGLVAAWKRTYGASPAHLLLHLAGIALCACALAQSFDPRYEAVYKNLALWMVGGAILNDFVALPLYVGIDRIARTVWGALRGTRVRTVHAVVPVHPHPPEHAAHFDAAWGGGVAHDADEVPPAQRHVALVPGNGHVRFPVVMSLALLLVYGPNILRDTGRGYELTTGLAGPPDYAARWLLITAGLFVASAVIYGLRAAAARAAARRPPAP